MLLNLMEIDQITLLPRPASGSLPGVGREERRKESGGGRGGEMILLCCEGMLSHRVENHADGRWEARNAVPK